MNESRSGYRPEGAHPEHRSWRRSGREAGPERSWNIRFEAADTWVPAALVKNSPMLLAAAVEDVCWRVAADGWVARRPHWWNRRAYAVWRAQSEWLEQKRRRLNAMVDDALTAC